MYRISYFNVGDLMVTKEETVAAANQQMAEGFAAAKCEQFTGKFPVVLKQSEAVSYVVLIDGETAGGVTILPV